MSDNSSYTLSQHPTGAQIGTFANGLTVILLEDHSAPVVSAQAWCQAGSIHEGDWMGAGLSHVLEHMLFKGTHKRGKGKIDQEVQEAGGYMNAYTSFDRTVYYINAPSSGTEVAVDILCDIMQNASLPEEELTSELDVIRREMDMNQDDPGRRSARGLFETAYQYSPYRYTVIGYPDVFNRITREDVFDYYRRMYVPSNQFFVVVGDIDTKNILSQFSSCYANATFQPLAPIYIPEEPKQLSARIHAEEAPIELGHAHFSWHIPDIRHSDLPALEALAIVLGGGRSSRLHQQLREKQALVHAIDAWTYNPGKPGLIGISAVFDGPRYPEVLKAVENQIMTLIEDGIQAQDLEKAIKQFKASTLSSQKTMQGQAQDLGSSWMAARDLGFSSHFLEQMQQLKPEDLVRVAQQYLGTETQTVYALLPPDTAAKAPHIKTRSDEHPVETWQSAEGMRVLFKRDHRLPFVELRSVFFGGVLTETPSLNGITQWMSQGLLKGTSKKTAAELMEQIESVGGSIDAYAGNNSFGINLECMQSDTQMALECLREVLQDPTFPEEEIERERQVQLAGIQAQKDQLLGRCLQLMRRGLFGNRYYGMTSLGQEATVSSFTREALLQHSKRWMHPGNQVLAIYGDMDPEHIKPLLNHYWDRSQQHLEPVTPIELEPQTIVLPADKQETTDKKQSVVVVGFKGCRLDDPQRHALDLIQETCSDLGSRLFMKIRDELGLAYYVGAQHMPGIIPGYFAFYAGTSPDHVDQVKEEMSKQIQHLVDQGITETELKRSKAKLLGQKKIARQSLGHLATQSALDELYGLGYMHQFDEEAAIESVTLEEVQQAAASVFLQAQQCTATVGPSLK